MRPSLSRIAIASLMILTGCTSGLKRPVASVELEPDPMGIQRVVVNMHGYYFEPNRIVVP